MAGKPPTKNKGGRPSSYEEHYASEAYQYALLGDTDPELAQHFNVNASTIADWKLKHPEFAKALKDGKAVADAHVSERLYQRALGFEYDEQIPIKVKEVLYDNGKRVSEKETVVMKTVHRIIPPDPTSMIFWLKNRRPDVWRDKRDVEHTFADVTKLTDEQLAEARRAMLKLA